jgi:hypothetical protein
VRAILAAFLLATAAMPLVLHAPTADAVGICSQYKDWYCDDYILCIGYRYDSRGFQCTGPGVRDPCSFHCYLP